MAVILGKKLVIDSKQFEDYAIGITLPIQIGNTAFNQSFITADQVKSNIKNLLLTKRFERLMQPEFGSGIQELLFNMNDKKLGQLNAMRYILNKIPYPDKNEEIIQPYKTIVYEV